MDDDLDLITPDLEGVPVDDDAEPDDAGIEHTATPEEVDHAEEMGQ